MWKIPLQNGKGKQNPPRKKKHKSFLLKITTTEKVTKKEIPTQTIESPNREQEGKLSPLEVGRAELGSSICRFDLTPNYMVPSPLNLPFLASRLSSSRKLAKVYPPSSGCGQFRYCWSLSCLDCRRCRFGSIVFISLLDNFLNCFIDSLDGIFIGLLKARGKVQQIYLLPLWLMIS